MLVVFEASEMSRFEAATSLLFGTLKSDKSIIKSFKNIKKGDHILVSNLNETLEAEAIKINNKGRTDGK